MIHFEKNTVLLTNYIKTILVQTEINNIISIAALLIRGDHELNLFKLEQIDILKKPLVFLEDKEIIAFIGVTKNFLGPLGLKIPVIADISTFQMKNFTIGANIKNHFFINMNWGVDLSIPIIKDIRKVTKKDRSPDGSGYLNIKKSIEIGHIFQLGQQYSRKMKVFVKMKNGNQENLHMGCYGIGITRIVAAVIEQNNDNNGIIWPNSIAPFEVVILPINMHKFIEIKKIANIIYQEFKKNGIDVILDDRNERPGIMFNEMDLIGIPHQIIISTSSINNGNVEYRARKNKKILFVKISEITNFIVNILKD
jgi:prolyl-tRNA synthetase